MEASGRREKAQEDVGAAFSNFERVLLELLTEQAQQSVDRTLADIEDSGGFRIEAAEVEVSIRGLTISNDASAPPPGPVRKLTAVRQPAPSRTRGRPTGRVRTVLLDAFAGSDELLDTDALRAHLDRAGITTSADNLHQQLGRLVKAGALERAGRGVYRRRPGA